MMAVLVLVQHGMSKIPVYYRTNLDVLLIPKFPQEFNFSVYLRICCLAKIIKNLKYAIKTTRTRIREFKTLRINWKKRVTK